MTDLKEEQKRPATIYLALILIVIVIIALLLLLYPRTKPDAAGEAAPVSDDAGKPPEPTIITREVEKIVEVEKAVTVETLQQGLSDMGTLITEEYYFTDLISFSSIKKLLQTEIELPFTESSYLVSYDGVVDAGIDLSAARVEKDDELKKITVHIPKASIQNVTIDLNSFQLREEKAGLGNHLSVQDFNSSLLELENKARANAAERGLLEKADENARLVVSRFVCSLVDTTEYSLEFAEN